MLIGLLVLSFVRSFSNMVNSSQQLGIFASRSLSLHR